MPSLREPALDRDALRTHRHDDQRLVVVRGAFRRRREAAHPVGLRAVGDPDLAAVDHVIVAVLARGRADRGDVGARARFRHADAGDHLAGDRGREELLRNSARAEARQGGGGHVGLHADRHRHGAAAACCRAPRPSRPHSCSRAPAPPTAVGLVRPSKPSVAQLLEHFVRREIAGVLPRVDVRVDSSRQNRSTVRRSSSCSCVKSMQGPRSGPRDAEAQRAQLRRGQRARNRCSTCASTRRVSRGSMMPSSSMRPDV